MSSQKKGRTAGKDPLKLFEKFPDVMQRISSMLTLNDLRKCAQVCKKWNQFARAAAGGQRSTLHVTTNCGELQAVGQLIKYPNFSLVNCLQVSIQADHECRATLQEGEYGDWYKNLRSLRLRQLSLYVSPCRSSHRIMEHLLRGSAATLEALELFYKRKRDTYEGDELLDWGLDIYFPELKKVKVGPTFYFPWFELRNIVNAAPKIEAIEGVVCLTNLKELDSSRLRALKAVDCFPVRGIDSALASLIDAQPQLTELQFYDDEEMVIPASWTNHLQSMLQISSHKLQSLSACAVLLMQFGHSGELSIPGLRYLELFFPEEATLDCFAQVMDQIHLPNVCPGLTALRLNFSDNCFHPVTNGPTRNRTAGVTMTSVKKVTLEDPMCNVAVINYCIRTFPAVTEFAFECLSCAEICGNNCGHLLDSYRMWTEIRTLKRLKICVTGADRIPGGFTLDALFCGLTANEAELLKNSQRDGLISVSAMQYCPVRPSIAHAHGLKELQIIFPPGYTYEAFPITEVSGHLSFARQPLLHVCIESHTTTISQELRPVEPFAEIAYVTDGRPWW